MRRVGRFVMFVWRVLAGALFCSTVVLSIAAAGWMYRAMQRAVHKRWHRCANVGFDQPWPGWLTHRGRGGWRRVIGSIVANFRIGGQAVFNTWVVTMPGCVLWLFAWYAGWDNSFNKGYEQAAIGPATGVLGVVLFIAVMFYLPMAQARQASTGNWRSFYQFKQVRAVIRQKWLACLGLAAAFAAVSLPVTILKTLPISFDRMAGYEQMTDEQVIKYLQQYFFFACLFVFPSIVWVRLLAGRIYAGGMLAALHSGAIERGELDDREAQVLGELNLLEGRAQPQRHVLLRISINMTNRAARWTCGGIAALLWFTFVAQIFVAEFLNHHPIIGWMNQPLVQLPWFKYLP